MISRDDPASVPVAVAAGVLLAAAATGACRALWRRTAALLAAGRQARRLPGAGQVVVIDDEAADAYTLPGWPCRIVVTAGMMRALSHPERQVLLAHERAHASGLHYLFTTAARLAAAANPLLRPVAAAVGYTVERWADERAAAVAGDRRLAARAIATGRPGRHGGPAPPREPAAALARSPVRPRSGCRRCAAPGRCRAGSPPCSARRRSPGCCCSPRPSCWSRSPGPPPWKPPSTCTACSTTPAPSAFLTRPFAATADLARSPPAPGRCLRRIRSP